jgi:hypothetical protein
MVIRAPTRRSEQETKTKLNLLVCIGVVIVVCGMEAYIGEA